MKKLEERYAFEIIMIDDGSSDLSWHLIETLAQEDLAIKGISFSRNFGHQIALSAGYDFALGDAVITMDADMQHPPSLLFAMINEWEKKADIVYVRNAHRNDRLLKKITAGLFYTLLDHLSYVKIPRDVQDFRLLDKKVARVIRQSREKSRYLRGMVAWAGFKYTILDAEYNERYAGKSGYNWSKMFKLAFDGITNFSLFPLKIASYIGIFVIITGLAMFSYISIDALFFHVHYPLFKWLVTVIYIFIGILFILLWFIGEYIGRIYEELKQRPLYIVDQEINIKR